MRSHRIIGVLAALTVSFLASVSSAQTPSTTLPPSVTQPSEPPRAPIEKLGAPITPSDGSKTTASAPGKPAQAVRGQIMLQSAGTILSTDLVGAIVQASDNEKIGTVSNVILKADGSVAGIVVGMGGFLGLGQRNVAVDMDQVKIRMDNNKPLVTMSANRADLDNAPPFKSLAEQQTERDAEKARQTSPASQPAKRP